MSPVLRLVKPGLRDGMGRHRSVMPNFNMVPTRVAALHHFARLLLRHECTQERSFVSRLKQPDKRINAPIFYSTASRAAQVESGVASTAGMVSQLPVDKVLRPSD